MLRIGCLLGLIFVSAPSANAADDAVLEAQRRRVEVVEQAAKSVVAIFGPSGGGGGSGVVISPDGFVLTNYHVTSGAGDWMKCGLNDGRLYDGVIVSIDPTGDVALVKLLGRDDFPFAPLGDSDTVRLGDWTYAMGNPFLLATDFQPTVTFGIVSGIHRYQEPAGNNFLEYTDCIQVDTSINPGNSGGPLFNTDGEVIGINGRGSFEKRGRVNSGAGYAISINQIKHFLEHLKSGRILDHATLGATVTTRSDGAVMVADILEESEAYRRGLRTGDEIISFGNRPIRSVNQFKNVLGIYPKGWKVPLVYRRDGQRHTIHPRLRALHYKSDFQTQKPPELPEPKPGDPKIPRDPEDPKQPKDPEREAPPNLLGRKPKPPEEYKHMLVKKDGFANYYFNELEQQRLRKHLDALGDFTKVGGPWKLTGNTAAGTAFELTLSDENITFTSGNQTVTQDVGLDADLGDKPAGSGGLLTAMHTFRLLLAKPKALTDLYYLGAEPLVGTEGAKADVLMTKYVTADTRWYFDPESGQLLGFDTFLDEDGDPCEIRIIEWTDFGGRQFPKQVQIRYGDQDFATWEIQSAEFGAKN